MKCTAVVQMSFLVHCMHPTSSRKLTPPARRSIQKLGPSYESGKGFAVFHPTRWQAVLLVLGATGAICGGVVTVGCGLQREMAPELTEDFLVTAEERWKADGPGSYDMEIEIGGDRAGVVRIEVRDGEVTSMERDGKTPPLRTWDVWSVPGLFDVLYRELELAADPVGEIQASKDTHWSLVAEFDRQFGYPQRYRRIVMGTGPDISWEVRKFNPVE